MQQITPDEADALIRASWPARRGGTPACTAQACNQGRKPCPTPDACRVPERSDADYRAAARFWTVYLLASLAAVASLLLWLLPAR